MTEIPENVKTVIICPDFDTAISKVDKKFNILICLHIVIVILLGILIFIK